jgi:hypothetical protein
LHGISITCSTSFRAIVAFMTTQQLCNLAALNTSPKLLVHRRQFCVVPTELLLEEIPPTSLEIISLLGVDFIKIELRIPPPSCNHVRSRIWYFSCLNIPSKVRCSGEVFERLPGSICNDFLVDHEEEVLSEELELSRSSSNIPKIVV